MIRIKPIVAIWLITAVTGQVLKAAPSTAQVQEGPATTAPAESAPDLNRLRVDLIVAIQARRFDQAADICRKLSALDPTDPMPEYNLACCLARKGQKDDAFAALQKAIDNGWADTVNTAGDDDLQSLTDDPRFALKLAAIRKNQEKAPYEHGEQIAGIKSVEGFPENGLRYRVRMSADAGPDKPERLIVWMHPSNPMNVSGDSEIEKLSARFSKLGYALAVFTQKQYENWTPAEGDALLKYTLPAMSRIPGIDAKKPIMLCFSAGGQSVLEMYYKNPGQFGGLILDAVSPIDMTKYHPGMRAADTVLHDLPADPAIKNVPVFVIAGQKDGISVIWKARAEKAWRDAGIPLVCIYVPNHGHEWLFSDPRQLSRLEDWLKQIAAGHFPTTIPTQP